MPETKKYKVRDDFHVHLQDGKQAVHHKPGSVIDLTDDQAKTHGHQIEEYSEPEAAEDQAEPEAAEDQAEPEAAEDQAEPEANKDVETDE